MQKSIHGHKVLKLIREHNQPVSKSKLLTTMVQHFGSESRFHTCSAKELSAEQLVELFLDKGKLSLKNEEIHFVGCQCNH